MDNKLRCNKILVTGGGSGIGKAIAKRFVEEGAEVIICGRNVDKLKKAKEEINSEKLYILQWDITQISAFENKMKSACELMGYVDGFVNAAALGSMDVTPQPGREYEPWDTTEEEWDKMSNTNYKAAFFMMRNEVDYMLKNNIRGNVLNFASNAACMEILGPYGAAKLSIIKWTRTFGKRFGHNGIIINGIAPGSTATPMIGHYCTDENQPFPRHAIERFIKPNEIAELARYLMSEMGEIVCGHTVVADGGDNCATL